MCLCDLSPPYALRFSLGNISVCICCIISLGLDLPGGMRQVEVGVRLGGYRAARISLQNYPYVAEIRKQFRVVIFSLLKSLFLFPNLYLLLLSKCWVLWFNERRYWHFLYVSRHNFACSFFFFFFASVVLQLNGLKAACELVCDVLIFVTGHF